MNSLQEYELLLRSMSKQMSLAQKTSRNPSQTPLRDRSTNHSSRVSKPPSNRSSPLLHHRRSTPALMQMGPRHISPHQQPFAAGIPTSEAPLRAVSQPNAWPLPAPRTNSHFLAPALLDPMACKSCVQSQRGQGPPRAQHFPYWNGSWNSISNAPAGVMNGHNYSTGYAPDRHRQVPAARPGEFGYGAHDSFPPFPDHNFYEYQMPNNLDNTSFSNSQSCQQQPQADVTARGQHLSPPKQSKPKAKQDDGPELIGMGLYDSPQLTSSNINSSDNSSMPSDFWYSSYPDSSYPSAPYSQQPSAQGLNLKLEESWKPPTPPPSASPAEQNVPEAEDDTNGIDSPLLPFEEIEALNGGLGQQAYGQDTSSMNAATEKDAFTLFLEHWGGYQFDFSAPEPMPGYSGCLSEQTSTSGPQQDKGNSGYSSHAPPQKPMEQTVPTQVRDENGQMVPLTNDRTVPNPTVLEFPPGLPLWPNGAGSGQYGYGFNYWA